MQHLWFCCGKAFENFRTALSPSSNQCTQRPPQEQGLGMSELSTGLQPGAITVERSVERNIPCCSWALLQSMAGCPHEQSGLLPAGQVPALLCQRWWAVTEQHVPLYSQALCRVQGPWLMEGLMCVGGNPSCEWGTGIISPNNPSAPCPAWLPAWAAGPVSFSLQSFPLGSASASPLHGAVARDGGVKSKWWIWEEDALLALLNIPLK